MIKIEEKQTSKLPGITSLFVSFDYNAAVVEAIKTLPNYTYDKKTFTWEIPVTSLAKLLNLLNPLDDITLTILPVLGLSSAIVSSTYLLPSSTVKSQLPLGISATSW